ncbi:MAG TPA: DUF4861 family protein [Prolixibacteraceae bacterium]|nr:DUF4861 family protein [Prolixibacteraceae bacterium]
MKSTLLLILLVSLLVSCNSEFGVQIVNPSSVDLNAKAFEFKRAGLEQLLGNLQEYSFAILTDKAGNEFFAQTDDLDGDGHWDVLFAQIDIKANEEKFLKVDWDPTMDISSRTNIRFADYNDSEKEFDTAERLTSNSSEIIQEIFQMEGPAWENEIVGFRNYFDARNGMDIFGKVTDALVLDSCGLKGGPTYHEMRSWGMDILKVANSLGAGALALETSSGLYRVGPGCRGTYRLVKEGPLRSILDLEFEGIPIDNQTVHVKHRISIEAGKPYYKSQVWVEDAMDMKLVTGIVNLHSDSVYSKTLDSVSYFYTHDNQAYNGEKLGMAILVPCSTLVILTAPEEGEGITQTFYTSIALNEQPIEFCFVAGWEKTDPAFATRESFETMVEREAIQWSVVPEITYKVEGKSIGQ